MVSTVSGAGMEEGSAQECTDRSDWCADFASVMRLFGIIVVMGHSAVHSITRAYRVWDLLVSGSLGTSR